MANPVGKTNISYIFTTQPQHSKVVVIYLEISSLQIYFIKIGGEFLSRKLTQLEVNERVALTNKDIDILESYTDSKVPFLCRCKVCTHEWRISLSNIISGKRCPKCVIRESAERYKKSTEQFRAELMQVNSNIDFDGEYVNCRVKLICHCLACGHTWSAKPDNLLSGYGCPACWSVRRVGITMRSHETFVQQLSEKHPTICTLSPYVGVKIPIPFFCQQCGHEWVSTPDTMLHKVSGCPNCSASHGEVAVSNYLAKNNISYTKWKKFDDLIGLGGGFLSYDFYIPDKNMLIEYQGQFHDESANSEFFHNDLERQRAHDQLKREYARSNQFRLLEIWYYDFKKINEILDAELAS